MAALLVAVQYVFGFVVGVELVSVLLLCFCVSFGVRCGVLTATAFSLLRCLLYGFSPNVVLLYLIYYNLFACVFGLLRKRRLPAWVVLCLLGMLAFASAWFAVKGIPISVLYQRRVAIMLWLLFSICIALLLLYFVLLFTGRRGGELAGMTALAAFCTVLFTLFDDILTPLVLSYSAEAAAGYFYTSFLAMLPQTVFVAISVFALYEPLKRIFSSFARGK